MHPPFSNFIFSKSSCAPTCKFSDRSDQQFLRKLTFFVKKWHFKKMHFLVKISTLGKASALRFSPAFSASSFLVVCQILAPKLFSMLRNVCFFLTENDQKLSLKNVQNLVNYATFEIYSCGKVL